MEKAFGENHRNVEFFELSEGSINSTWSELQWSEHYRETLQHKIAALKGFKEELEAEIHIKQLTSSARPDVESERSKKVFIVHGHNNALRTCHKISVSLFLQN